MLPKIFKVLLSLFFLHAASASAVENTLSLSAAKRIALDTNPLARAAAEGLQIACAKTCMAKSPYYPEVGAGAHFMRWEKHNFLELDDPTMVVPPSLLPDTIGPTNDYFYHIYSRYTLYDWGERRAELLAACANQRGACSEEERIHQEILLNVSTAFFQLIAAVELEDVALQTLERAKSHLSIAKKREDVGDVPLSDVLRAQVDVAEGKQGLVRAENLVRIARTNLNAAMGLPPDIEIDVAAEKRPAILIEEAELRTAQARAVSNRPEMRIAKERVCSLKYQIDKAKAAFGPKFTGEAAYGQRDSDWPIRDPEWVVGVSVNVPIYTGNRLQCNVRRAKAEFCKAKAEYDRLSLNIQQQVWKAYSKLLEAYERIQTSIAQVRDATESMRLVSERYSAGASTMTDVLDSQTALARAEATQVDAFWTFEEAKTAFLWTQGLLE